MNRFNIISTVIARYAAFNLDGQISKEFAIPLKEYDKRIDDAEDSPLAIVRIERPIRARSMLFQDLTPPEYPYRKTNESFRHFITERV